MNTEGVSVGVYGLGRFGSFWASQLSNHVTVKGYSRNPDHLPAGVIRVDEDELLASPVLILCVAISAMKDVLTRISARIAPGSLVMDTCSIKVYPVELMREILPDSVSLLATHPMFGPDSANGGLSGLPLVMCPVRAAEKTVQFWNDFFRHLGLHVHVMTPEDHDREAAFTQGVTHFIGRVLAAVDLRESKISTLGYRKLLEIIEQTCNDSWQLFLDLQRYNPYTRQMRSTLNRSLSRLHAELDATLDTPEIGDYDTAHR